MNCCCDLKPNPAPEKELGEVDKFCCLGSHISPGGRTSDEVPPRIQKGRIPTAKLRDSWRRCGVPLPVEGCL